MKKNRNSQLIKFYKNLYKIKFSSNTPQSDILDSFADPTNMDMLVRQPCSVAGNPENHEQLQEKCAPGWTSIPDPNGDRQQICERQPGKTEKEAPLPVCDKSNASSVTSKTSSLITTGDLPEASENSRNFYASLRNSIKNELVKIQARFERLGFTSIEKKSLDAEDKDEIPKRFKPKEYTRVLSNQMRKVQKDFKKLGVDKKIVPVSKSKLNLSALKDPDSKMELVQSKSNPQEYYWMDRLTNLYDIKTQEQIFEEDIVKEEDLMSLFGRGQKASFIKHMERRLQQLKTILETNPEKFDLTPYDIERFKFLLGENAKVSTGDKVYIGYIKPKGEKEIIYDIAYNDLDRVDKVIDSIKKPTDSEEYIYFNEIYDSLKSLMKANILNTIIFSKYKGSARNSSNVNEHYENDGMHYIFTKALNLPLRDIFQVGGNVGKFRTLEEEKRIQGLDKFTHTLPDFVKPQENIDKFKSKMDEALFKMSSEDYAYITNPADLFLPQKDDENAKCRGEGEEGEPEVNCRHNYSFVYTGLKKIGGAISREGNLRSGFSDEYNNNLERLHTFFSDKVDKDISTIPAEDRKNLRLEYNQIMADLYETIFKITNEENNYTGSRVYKNIYQYNTYIAEFQSSVNAILSEDSLGALVPLAESYPLGDVHKVVSLEGAEGDIQINFVSTKNGFGSNASAIGAVPAVKFFGPSAYYRHYQDYHRNYTTKVENLNNDSYTPTTTLGKIFNESSDLSAQMIHTEASAINKLVPTYKDNKWTNKGVGATIKLRTFENDSLFVRPGSTLSLEGIFKNVDLDSKEFAEKVLTAKFNGLDQKTALDFILNIDSNSTTQTGISFDNTEEFLDYVQEIKKNWGNEDFKNYSISTNFSILKTNAQNLLEYAQNLNDDRVKSQIISDIVNPLVGDHIEKKMYVKTSSGEYVEKTDPQAIIDAYKKGLHEFLPHLTEENLSSIFSNIDENGDVKSQCIQGLQSYFGENNRYKAIVQGSVVDNVFQRISAYNIKYQYSNMYDERVESLSNLLKENELSDKSLGELKNDSSVSDEVQRFISDMNSGLNLTDETILPGLQDAYHNFIDSLTLKEIQDYLKVCDVASKTYNPKNPLGSAGARMLNGLAGFLGMYNGDSQDLMLANYTRYIGGADETIERKKELFEHFEKGEIQSYATTHDGVKKAGLFNGLEGRLSDSSPLNMGLDDLTTYMQNDFMLDDVSSEHFKDFINTKLDKSSLEEKTPQQIYDLVNDYITQAKTSQNRVVTLRSPMGYDKVITKYDGNKESEGNYSAIGLKVSPYDLAVYAAYKLTVGEPKKDKKNNVVMKKIKGKDEDGNSIIIGEEVVRHPVTKEDRIRQYNSTKEFLNKFQQKAKDALSAVKEERMVFSESLSKSSSLVLYYKKLRSKLKKKTINNFSDGLTVQQPCVVKSAEGKITGMASYERDRACFDGWTSVSDGNKSSVCVPANGGADFKYPICPKQQQNALKSLVKRTEENRVSSAIHNVIAESPSKFSTPEEMEGLLDSIGVNLHKKYSTASTPQERDILEKNLQSLQQLQNIFIQKKHPEELSMLRDEVEDFRNDYVRFSRNPNNIISQEMLDQRDMNDYLDYKFRSFRKVEFKAKEKEHRSILKDLQKKGQLNSVYNPEGIDRHFNKSGLEFTYNTKYGDHNLSFSAINVNKPSKNLAIREMLGIKPNQEMMDKVTKVASIEFLINGGYAMESLTRLEKLEISQVLKRIYAETVKRAPIGTVFINTPYDGDDEQAYKQRVNNYKSMGFEFLADGEQMGTIKNSRGKVVKFTPDFIDNFSDNLIEIDPLDIDPETIFGAFYGFKPMKNPTKHPLKLYYKRLLQRKTKRTTTFAEGLIVHQPCVKKNVENKIIGVGSYERKGKCHKGWTSVEDKTAGGVCVPSGKLEPTYPRCPKDPSEEDVDLPGEKLSEVARVLNEQGLGEGSRTSSANYEKVLDRIYFNLLDKRDNAKSEDEAKSISEVIKNLSFYNSYRKRMYRGEDLGVEFERPRIINKKKKASRLDSLFNPEKVIRKEESDEKNDLYSYETSGGNQLDVRISDLGDEYSTLSYEHLPIKEIVFSVNDDFEMEDNLPRKEKIELYQSVKEISMMSLKNQRYGSIMVVEPYEGKDKLNFKKRINNYRKLGFEYDKSLPSQKHMYGVLTREGIMPLNKAKDKYPEIFKSEDNMPFSEENSGLDLSAWENLPPQVFGDAFIPEKKSNLSLINFYKALNNRKRREFISFSTGKDKVSQPCVLKSSNGKITGMSAYERSRACYNGWTSIGEQQEGLNVCVPARKSGANFKYPTCPKGLQEVEGEEPEENLRDTINKVLKDSRITVDSRNLMKILNAVGTKLTTKLRKAGEENSDLKDSIVDKLDDLQLLQDELMSGYSSKLKTSLSNEYLNKYKDLESKPHIEDSWIKDYYTYLLETMRKSQINDINREKETTRRKSEKIVKPFIPSIKYEPINKVSFESVSKIGSEYFDWAKASMGGDFESLEELNSEDRQKFSAFIRKDLVNRGLKTFKSKGEKINDYYNYSEKDFSSPQQQKRVKLATEKAIAILGGLFKKPENPIRVFKDKKEKRPYQMRVDGNFVISTGNSIDNSNPIDIYRSMIHEIGHIFEKQSKNVLDMSVQYITNKASGSPKKLSELTGNPNYADSEVAYPGSFIHPYIGKISKTKSGVYKSTEVISMGLEPFGSDRDDIINFFKKDPDHLKYILGILLTSYNQNPSTKNYSELKQTQLMKYYKKFLHKFKSLV